MRTCDKHTPETVKTIALKYSRTEFRLKELGSYICSS